MQNSSEQEKYWIWLKSVKEVTPKLFYYIMREFLDAERFFDAVNKNSSALSVVPEKALASLKAVCSRQYIVELICEMRLKNIHTVTRLSEDYPQQLAKIPYPPPVLYVKGSLAGIEREISIVGTRWCTRQGAELSRTMAKELGTAGMAIVSGMARGIDSAAHRGAIDAGAKTIAVLGCGTDVIYPPESEDIYHQAIENGAVVSELAAGTEPLAANFPARNRIIAGFSRGTVVVESGLKGGTAITASLAVSYIRDLFAVPGSPYQSTAALSDLLIKKGAVPVENAADILDYYGYPGRRNTPEGQNEEIQLDFLQRQLYNLLLQGDIGVENIAAQIEYPQSEINIALTMMELSGLIKRLPGGKYGI